MIAYKSGECSMVRWIVRRITKLNKNFIALYSAETGGGKTWSAIRLAYSLDPNFDAEKQIVFSFREMMGVLTCEDFKELKTKVIIFDEPQTDISRREWRSKINKLFNYVLSTFRHQNVVLLLCSPYEDFLDSSSMKLVHAIFECRSIDGKKKICKIKPLLLQYNSRRKKTYNKFLRVLRDKKNNKFEIWKVKKPPQHLIDIFEAKKTKFTDALNKSILQELEDEDQPKRKALTDKQQDVYDLMQEHDDVEKVSELLDISNTAVYKHIESIKNKNYIFKTKLEEKQR